MKSKLQPQQQQSSPAPPAEFSGAATSNQEASAQIDPTGLQRYTETLGSMLGPELYEAVSDALTEEAFAGYTSDAVDAIFSELSKLAGGIGGDASDAQIEGFAAALQARLGPIAEAWVAENGEGLRESLRGWVDANPVAIASTALLAAAGAVMADLDIPTLAHELELTEGLTVGAEAELGSLRNIALEQIKVSLDYASGPLIAAMNVGYSDDGVTADASVRLQGEQWSGGIAGSLDAEGDLTATTDLAYDNGDVSLSALGTFGDQGLQRYDLSASFGSSERLGLGLGLSGTGEDWRATGSAEIEREDVRAELEAWLKSDGGVGGSASVDFTSGDWQASGDLSFQLGDERVLDVGLHAGFRSRQAFRTWMGSYAFASEHSTHTFSLLAEEKLGSLYTRFEHSTALGAMGEQHDTRIQGAYFLDEGAKEAIIIGVRHLRDFDGSHSFTPEVGMQLDRNALTLGYDIERESLMLNFVMPFGR